MNRNLFTTKHAKLEYHIYGSGKKPMLAFHGFGRHASDFKPFASKVGTDYTLYAFNLIHHGNSSFKQSRNDSAPITKKELATALGSFTKELNLTKISVCGYSLGGKIALSSLEIMPNRIDEIWLFAPDGVKVNFWYKLATNSVIGRKTYRYLLESPHAIQSLMNFSTKLKLVHPRLKKFAEHNLGSDRQRELAKTVWLTYRKLNPNMDEVKSIIVEKEIPVYQYYGKYDRVIPPKIGRDFSKSIGQSQNFFELEKGHALLDEDVMNDLPILYK